MPDRKKVIKGLEKCCIEKYCKQCPYKICSYNDEYKLCIYALCQDALALLKEQESGAKGGCDGCIYKGSNDCQLDQTRDGNVVCPNGKLNIT